MAVSSFASWIMHCFQTDSRENFCRPYQHFIVNSLDHIVFFTKTFESHLDDLRAEIYGSEK